MSQTPAEKRMTENEVIFRRYNESVKKGLDELKNIATEENHAAQYQMEDAPLYFYCECSDENCVERIKLKPSLYNSIHTNRSKFIIVPGHESESIELVTNKMPGYVVVEKNVKPSESVSKLQKTDIDNT
jgi:hypothetical protein